MAYLQRVFILVSRCVKLSKFINTFQSYDNKCTATFLWFTVYINDSVLGQARKMHSVISATPPLVRNLA